MIKCAGKSSSAAPLCTRWREVAKFVIVFLIAAGEDADVLDSHWKENTGKRDGDVSLIFTFNI